MGTRSISSNLSGALFSRVQARVLGILFLDPDRSFPITEIISRADSGRGAVQRELEKLTNVGIAAVTLQGSRRLYHANRTSPIFHELHQLILKTVGIVGPIRDALAPYQPSINCAFIYGSIAKGDETAKSDIDLMIVGNDLAYSEVFTALQAAEKVLARPINPNLTTAEEWGRKVSNRNSFMAKMLSQPKLFIFGTEDELRGIG